MISLNEKQAKEFEEFLQQQRKEAIAEQKRTVNKQDPFYGTYQQSWDLGFPYCGAIGGEYSFVLTPTSIGTMIKVVYNPTKVEKNLTDWSEF